MKSSKQINIKHIIPFFLITALFLITNVMLRKEIRMLTKNSSDKNQSLSIKHEKIEELNVEIQKLTSEERIIELANSSLGLVRPEAKPKIIKINEDQIKQLQKVVNDKYE